MSAYKLLLNQLGERLKPMGFGKKGSTFYLKKVGNWALIDFQTSRGSSAGNTIFTINLGVFSETIKTELGNPMRLSRGKLFGRPGIEDCHWRKRVGFIMPSKKDFWWALNEDSDFEELYNEVEIVVLSKVIPELDDNISDSSLEQNWLSGISEGLTDFQRYRYLTALLKFYGRPNINDVANEMLVFSKGKGFESAAKNHLKGLGIIRQ